MACCEGQSLREVLGSTCASGAASSRRPEAMVVLGLCNPEYCRDGLTELAKAHPGRVIRLLTEMDSFRLHLSVQSSRDT